MARVAMEPAAVQLWVRTEPFLVGALQLLPPAKLGPHYLRKMAAYARARAAEGCYPRLTWPMWRHIACGKLQLARDLAWLYFEVFDSLAERTAEQRLERAEVLSGCASDEELEQQRSKARETTL